MEGKSTQSLRALMLASVALAAASAGPLAPAAHAQAVQPVVDVCTGLSLPRSEVTDVIGDVNQPILTQTETTVNGINTLTGGTVPDLNVNLTPILDNAAAGAPLTLQVVDTDGNVVTPSDSCNLTADGFTLGAPAGIAIGGNQITGLGADGQGANAAELDAIAFGNNATTTAGADGAVALGTGASVTAANGVALGAGSVADRGAQTGYTAPGLAGTFDSAGSVSVGAPGAERQITNVAPGTAATDAATVGQVTGAIAAATADAVEYDDAAHGTVTFDGAGGTRLTNVAPGTLAADSTDAVNGAQLFATNQTLGTLQAQVANVPVRYVSDADGTTPSATPTDTAALVSASGGPAGLTNVAPGALTAASTDAVNGAQLYATNQQVAANTDAIEVLNTTVAGAPRSPVQYSNAEDPTVANGGTRTNDVTLVGADDAAPVALHNLADGALPNDAANLGQVESGMAQTLAGARSYTDQEIASVNFDLGELDSRVGQLREDAFSGTASAMALFGIPQTMEPGKMMIGGGVGHYRGETSFAIGLSGSLADGRAVVKAAGTMDAHGNGGFSAGAGFSF